MAEHLTTAQVAAELHVTPSAISQMVKRGDIDPAHKLPGLRGPYLFTRTELERVQSVRHDTLAVTA